MSGQDTADEMAGFVAEHDVGGFDHVADLHGEIWAVFGVSAQPSYIFINDDGTISRHIGGMSSAAMVEQLDLLISD